MNKAAASAAVPAGEAGAGTPISVRELEGAPTCIAIAEGRRHTGLCLRGTVIVLGMGPSASRAGADEAGAHATSAAAARVVGQRARSPRAAPPSGATEEVNRECECEAPGPSLLKLTCRDCDGLFDRKRQQLRKEGKRDPLSCYHCRGRRRSAYIRARDAARTAGVDEAGAHATGAAAARAAGSGGGMAAPRPVPGQEGREPPLFLFGGRARSGRGLGGATSGA